MFRPALLLLFVSWLAISATAQEKPDFLYEIKKPIKTVIVPKGVERNDPDWTVYSDPAMNYPQHKFAPGDSVTIKGWGPWCFFMEKDKNHYGYASYLSVNSGDKDLDSLVQVIEARSPEEANLLATQPFNLETIDNFTTPGAFLSLTANKTSVYEGECVTLTLAFVIKDFNNIPIQFSPDLPMQLTTLRNNGLQLPYCLKVEENISDIIGEEKMIDTSKVISYTIYNSSYCPAKVVDIRFNRIRLGMLICNSKTRAPEKLAIFQTEPLTIQVKPWPAGISTTTSQNPRITGKFKLEERIEQNIKTGTPVQYEIRLSGNGLLFAIPPPKLKIPNASATLIDVQDTDTLEGGLPYTTKKFIYQLIFHKMGSYAWKDQVKFDYFNPITQKKSSLRSTLSTVVSNGKEPKAAATTHESFYTKSTLIAVDISQSMEIMDYTPNRLEAVKTALGDVLPNRKACDIGVITFSGRSEFFNVRNGETCYDTGRIKSISINRKRKQGTAIGDVIWFALNAFKEGSPKKLIIIGDGENTNGAFVPQYAARLAQANNIKIYTIGVGQTEHVQYGKDTSGNPIYIKSQPVNGDLQRVATLTGGEFFWAKDVDQLKQILRTLVTP
jgi:hypothetical protein